jgi:hypothetical protein
MRLALAAFTAALLMIAGAPIRAQQSSSAAGTPGATAAEPKPVAEPKAAPGSVGISISPKTRKKLLQDLLNAVAPRPAAPTATTATTAPAEASSTPPGATQPATLPAGTPTVVATPPPPRPAAGAALTPAATLPSPNPAAVAPKPRPPLPPAGSTPTPRPVPEIAPSPPLDQPPKAEPILPTAPPPAPVPVAIDPVVQPPLPAAETPRSIFGASPMLLLGLLAALAALAAATAMRVQRARRIERTRAALVVTPRLDLAAGASSIRGLSMGRPPLAIRARLAT